MKPVVARTTQWSLWYAERIAILLHFGNQNPSIAGHWVKTMVNAQLQDGNWGLYSETGTM